jgi:hypothetical protein
MKEFENSGLVFLLQLLDKLRHGGGSERHDLDRTTRYASVPQCLSA